MTGAAYYGTGERNMIRGFWAPTNWKQALLLLAVLLMVVLHQSELLGLMGTTTLLFGWLPLQLAYDILFGLVAVVVAYGIYRVAPDPPEEYRGSDETEHLEGK